MVYPVKPFTFSAMVWIVGGVASICLVGIPTVLMAILHFAFLVPKVNTWKQACSVVESKRDAIVAEARQY